MSVARRAGRQVAQTWSSCSIVAVHWPAVLLIQAQVAQLSLQLAAEYQYGVAVQSSLFLSLTNLSLNFTDALVSAF